MGSLRGMVGYHVKNTEGDTSGNSPCGSKESLGVARMGSPCNNLPYKSNGEHMGTTKKSDTEARVEQVRNQLPSEALLADGFDEAILGVCHRYGQEPVAAYDYERCISILMKDMSWEQAEEHFQYNVIGAWVGEFTPVFIYTVFTEREKSVLLPS